MASANRLLKLEKFRPGFTDDELASLQGSLRSAKLPTATYASKQERYGITHDWMQKALARWKDGFSWKAYEDKINAVDHYLTTIEDEGHQYKVHFIYHESKDPKAIPLMLLHGWPGSAFEFLEAVKILRESTSPAFHLIAPMLPGNGWSGPPPLDSPFHLEDCARLLDKLMVGLGFGSGYAVQGGDIGSGLARLLAVNFEGIPAPRELPALDDPKRASLSKREEQDLRRGEEWAKDGKAYGYVHCTRPGTIGIVVQSSPVALLAWLGEKFRDWVDIPLPLDDVLATCTMWWLRESFPSSIWAYPGIWRPRTPANHLAKPFGFSAYPKELSVMPKAWAAETGNLIFYRQHEKAGLSSLPPCHFPMVEALDAFVQDLKDFIAVAWQ
ncbi:hypothetical protein JCM10213v2_004446 [Rhodosporidiobolus nylandii]